LSTVLLAIKVINNYCCCLFAAKKVGTALTLIEISHDSCGTFDFFKAEEHAEIGRYATQEKFDSLQD
jgi:hypothetical protein